MSDTQNDHAGEKHRWLRGFDALETFRPANFFYCLWLFWICGSVKPDKCRTFPYEWTNADPTFVCSGLKILAEKNL